MQSRRVFDLRWVRDEEAEEVRRLLDEHGVTYFETPYGHGRGNPALWVNAEEDYIRARQLIDAHQNERQQNARAEFAPRLRRLRMHGHLPTRIYDMVSALFSGRGSVLLFLAVLAVFIVLAAILA